MIQGYADHAANERTFLAWVRTGVAVIAFGFVIEKFNLFLLSLLVLPRLTRCVDRSLKDCPAHPRATRALA